MSWTATENALEGGKIKRVADDPHLIPVNVGILLYRTRALEGQ